MPEQRKGKYPGVPEKAYPQFTVQWMAELWDKLTEDGSVMIIIDPHIKAGVMSDYVRRTEDALCEFGWVQHRTLIWHKRDRAPLGHKWWPRHCWGIRPLVREIRQVLLRPVGLRPAERPIVNRVHPKFSVVAWW